MLADKTHYTKLACCLLCFMNLATNIEPALAQVDDGQWPIVNGASAEDREMTSEVGEVLIDTEVEADEISGVRGEFLEATGNAVIIRGDQTIRGDYLSYDQIIDQVIGDENISLEKPGMLILGSELSYNPGSETGEIRDAEYFLTEIGARGKAKKLVFFGPRSQRAEGATYTSCDLESEDVYVKAGRLDIDQDEEFGSAKNATVWFKSAPILYTPYLSFPLTDKRKTGFLTPSYGQSVQNGFEVLLPFYWNIAPNVDGTVTGRSMSERGVLVETDWRYLGESFSGEFQFDHIDNDKIFQDQFVGESSRSTYTFSHLQRFGDKISGYLDFQGVSDDTYFKDLSYDPSLTSIAHIPRELGLNVGRKDWRGSMRVVHYQTLEFLTPPFQLDPQRDLDFFPVFGMGFESESSVQISDFDHQELNGALRTIVYPGIRYTFENEYLSVSPKIGYHYTNYDLDSGETEDRGIPIYSLRGSISFERPLLWGNTDLIQTLEPQFFYVHTPFYDQSHLPIFDTGLADFSLSTVFSENIFSGGDRINDADQFTIGVSSLIFDTDTGLERIKLTMAQRFHLGEEFVVLSASDPARTVDRSDIMFEAGGQINKQWGAASLLQYSDVLNEVIRHDHRVQYKPEEGKVLNLIYRYTRDDHEQYDISGQWPVHGRWGVAARWNYALDDSKLIEGVLGIEYKVGCWALRFAANRFLAGLDDVGDDLYATSFFVQLDLKGITRVGSDAIGSLTHNIRGYSEN